jgi:RecB family exonuclease
MYGYDRVAILISFNLPSCDPGVAELAGKGRGQAVHALGHTLGARYEACLDDARVRRMATMSRSLSSPNLRASSCNR